MLLVLFYNASVAFPLFFCGAGDPTQGLEHAGQLPQHWALSHPTVGPLVGILCCAFFKSFFPGHVASARVLFVHIVSEHLPYARHWGTLGLQPNTGHTQSILLWVYILVERTEKNKIQISDSDGCSEENSSHGRVWREWRSIISIRRGHLNWALNDKERAIQRTEKAFQPAESKWKSPEWEDV
jgi:hypothetical protein